MVTRGSRRSGKSLPMLAGSIEEMAITGHKAREHQRAGTIKRSSRIDRGLPLSPDVGGARSYGRAASRALQRVKVRRTTGVSSTDTDTRCTSLARSAP